MSNPPRQGGTSDVPINSPQSRSQAPPQAQSGRPQPPASAPRERPPAPAGAAAAQPAAGQARSVQAAPQAPQGTQRQPVPPRGVPPRTTGSHGRIPAAQQRQPIDLATRLDGQRGWLAQLDRSLRKRSIIALVLTCLAVGVGAAALYVSLTKNADSERIDALQTRVEALEAAAGIPSTDTTDPLAVPETDTTVPETGVPLPESGVTLPGGTTDSSGLVIPPSTSGE